MGTLEVFAAFARSFEPVNELRSEAHPAVETSRSLAQSLAKLETAPV